MLRGIEGYDYLWLIWAFSESGPPLVADRPPAAARRQRPDGGLRDPFSLPPEPAGLSSGAAFRGRGQPRGEDPPDCRGRPDGTAPPILDIKPYLPFTDSHPDAKGGFSDQVAGDKLAVETAPGLSDKLPPEKWEAPPSYPRPGPPPFLPGRPRPGLWDGVCGEGSIFNGGRQNGKAD